MGKKRHTAEEIIAKLRQAEIELSRGKTAAEACRAVSFPICEHSEPGLV